MYYSINQLFNKFGFPIKMTHRTLDDESWKFLVDHTCPTYLKTSSGTNQQLIINVEHQIRKHDAYA